MKNTLILKAIRNARNAAGGMLGFLLTAAVLGEPIAHGTPAQVGSDEKPAQPPDQLYGIWIAKDVEAELGEIKIHLTFRREPKATLPAWSDIPFVGKVRDLKRPFSVDGETISSEAIRDEKKAKYSLKATSWCCVSKVERSCASTRNSGRKTTFRNYEDSN